MHDDKNQYVAELFIARRWAWESDFGGDEPTDTVVQWPPAPPRPAKRTARGTLAPERDDDDEYDLQYETE
jgi:hypothetical protein